MNRVYFDHNATTPLRPEARAAMLEAMDVFGNPSSVHSEGRAAKRMMEKARRQISQAFGAEGADIVFTSGTTEAVMLAFNQDWDEVGCSTVEHDVVASRATEIFRDEYVGTLCTDKDGRYAPEFVSGFGMSSKLLRKGEKGYPRVSRGLFAMTAANSETGVIQPIDQVFKEFVGEYEVSHRFCDATQAFGKTPMAFNWMNCEYAAISGHKFGAPKGVGALVFKRGIDVVPTATGGGQEMGRRAGTENLIGIVGMGAAAEAASRDLEGETWARVEKLRIILENALEESAPGLIIAGKHANRLPNTSCFAVPGWKGETQVMQMDLAGFAVSAGSACSSGKVRESRVLRAMGYGPEIASSAIRVSLSPQNTEDEVLAFVAAWTQEYKRRKSRAA